MKIGQRVIVKDHDRVGKTFRGLIGTVVAEGESGRYYVKFDNPPDYPPQVKDYPGGGHGGTWTREYLEAAQSFCAGCDSFVPETSDYLCSKCRTQAPID